MDKNIFSGDELVILVHKSSLLIGGAELQQECFFCELSAFVSLEPTTKLDQDTQVSFCNRTLEYQESSHNISLSLPTSFYMEHLERHELEDAEPIGSLEEEKPCQDASEQTFALDAGRQELYKHTVGELVWAAIACRPDLSFEVHLLTQSLEDPTTNKNSSFTECLDTLLELRTTQTIEQRRSLRAWNLWLSHLHLGQKHADQPAQLTCSCGKLL